MNKELSCHRLETPGPERGLFWLSVVLVGAVFFYVAHNPQVSLYEGFTPWLDSQETLEAGRNVAKGLALGLVGLWGLFLLLRHSGRSLQLDGWLPALMMLYLGLAVASVLWSINLGMTCRRLAALGFCVLAAAGFARQFRPREIAVMAAAITGVYVFVGLAAEVALGTFRPWSPDYRFAGTIHPNSQGAQSAILCLAAFCLARSVVHGKRWLWTLFAGAIVCLLLSKSRTACAATGIALTALWMIETSGRLRVLVAAAVGMAAALAAAAMMTVGFDPAEAAMKTVMLGRAEHAETLVGRIPLWNESLAYVRARPLLGYGYESFWTDEHIGAISEALQWTVREAHNAYIEAMLSLGVIGAGILLAAVLLALCRAANACRNTSDPGFMLTFCLLVFAMADACLETGMGAPNFFTLMAGCGVMQLLSVADEPTTNPQDKCLAGCWFTEELPLA